MYHIYKGTKIHYQIIGSGEKLLVFLHGWGGCIESFKFICNGLNFSYKALIVDFPPFGNSEEPKCVWTIYDYSNFVSEIIKKEHFENSCIVGHSFGGRVGIILASQGIGNKLILTSSAGMKVKRGLKYYLKVKFYKLCKILKIKNNMGSSDYKHLSSIMKKTFVNIVNTFLEKYAITINVPTLLVWGDQDKDTPMYMARKLKKLISTSELIIFKGASHFAYVEQSYKFSLIVSSFINCN